MKTYWEMSNWKTEKEMRM